MTQELKAKEKAAVNPDVETSKGTPTFSPAVDIFESEEAMTLVADLPGVPREGLTIDLNDNVLTIRGEVAPAVDQDKKSIYREYQEGDFHRQFALSELIDQEKISAALKDGVLTLVLPKVGPSQPRKIAISGD
ncbi:MAG: Hsp20/alpha crystallin family protein [Pseudomonadota bacterium]